MIKRIIKYILLKCKWGRLCKFGFSVDISIKSTFEGMCQVHSHAIFHGSLGFGSYIGQYSYLSADIGRFTSIAPFVRCNYGIHPYTAPFVSTSPCFFSLNKERSQCGSTFATKQMINETRFIDENKKIGVKIGSDCWIGEGVFLVGGIEIGNGAVVLAHAVVTKDVPPYAIVGGVPAKVLRYRYDEDTVQFLLKIQWWNLPIEWLRKNWELFSDIETFKKKMS